MPDIRAYILSDALSAAAAAAADKMSVTASYVLSNRINQPFGFFPAKAWIRNGFTIYMFVYLLASGHEIALDHDALNQSGQFLVHLAAVQHLLYNAGLLRIQLIGVGMVSVHNRGRILQVRPFFIHMMQADQIFVMIIRYGLPVLINRSAQDGMRKWIAGGMNLPLTVHEGVSGLRRNAGIEHDR